MDVVNNKKGVIADPISFLPILFIFIVVGVFLLVILSYFLSMEVAYDSDETLRLGQDVAYRLAGSDECLAYKDDKGDTQRFILNSTALDNFALEFKNKKPDCAFILPSIRIGNPGTTTLKGVTYFYRVNIIDTDDPNMKSWSFGDNNIIKSAPNNLKEVTKFKQVGVFLVPEIVQGFVPAAQTTTFVSKTRYIFLPVGIYNTNSKKIHIGGMYITMYTVGFEEGIDWSVGERQINGIGNTINIGWGTISTGYNVITGAFT